MDTIRLHCIIANIPNRELRAALLGILQQNDELSSKVELLRESNKLIAGSMQSMKDMDRQCDAARALV